MTKPFVLRSSNAWVRYDESCEMSFGLALNVDTDVSVFAGLASRAWMDPAAAREVGGAQEVCICEEGRLAPAVQFNCRYGTMWSTCVCATVTCKRIEDCAHLFWLENVVLLLRAAKREGQVRLCFVRLGLSLVWEGWGVVDTYPVIVKPSDDLI